MDPKRLGAMTASLASGGDRRRILGFMTGAAGLLGLAVDTDAKKSRKKKKKRRCRRIQAVCRSNKECCPGKTGRVCASNAKDAGCNEVSNVCCLPPLSFGCTETCDCCGNTGCDTPTGQCVLQ